MTLSSRFAVVASLLALALPMSGCSDPTSQQEDTAIGAPSVLPDLSEDTEPKIQSVTTDDPNIVSVSPPDATRDGYRGYMLRFENEGETTVHIQTDQKLYDVRLTVTHRDRHNF